MTRLPRVEYAARFGPTTGDLVRLADTDLWIRIEDDHFGVGDEPIYGYGKTVRHRIFQQPKMSELDVVLLGVIVIDPLLGIVKTNIGIKDGRVAGIGRAGDPDVVAGTDLTIGPNTNLVIEAMGMIATPGGVDTHVHEHSPRLIPVALASGLTTLITAGFMEPARIADLEMRAMEQFPINFGMQLTARSEDPSAVERLIEDGAIGLKVHEDVGAYPEMVDAALRAADAHDVAVCLHTDGLHEVAEFEDTLAAIDGRALHVYHVEGTGGGHNPDLIRMVAHPHLLCSSTTPTIPYGRGTASEAVDMIMDNHGLSAADPAQVEAARERVTPRTMAAEGPLHELGAISIINSDSQGMGRIGEVVRRTWQLAHVMKRWRQTEQGVDWPEAPAVHRLAPRPDDPDGPTDDNERVLQYLAKYTLEPARTHGVHDHVGTIAPGRIADIVLWRPSHFGVKPAVVIKGGYLAWGAFGAGNASTPGAEPVAYGPWFSGLPSAAWSVSTTFVSQAGLASGVKERVGSRRSFVAVSGTRTAHRREMVANRAAPSIAVDATDGTVMLDGRVLEADPVETLPLNRRYLLA